MGCAHGPKLGHSSLGAGASSAGNPGKVPGIMGFRYVSIGSSAAFSEVSHSASQGD